MKVASLAECKELYQRSGWNEQYWWYTYHEYEDGSSLYLVVGEHEAPFHASTYPAYDVAFLLARLPGIVLAKSSDGSYRALWCDYADVTNLEGTSRTDPANALCRLAIELFKHGILKTD